MVHRKEKINPDKRRLQLVNRKLTSEIKELPILNRVALSLKEKDGSLGSSAAIAGFAIKCKTAFAPLCLVPRLDLFLRWSNFALVIHTFMIS